MLRQRQNLRRAIKGLLISLLVGLASLCLNYSALAVAAEDLEELVINSNQELCQKLGRSNFASIRELSCDEVRNDEAYELGWIQLTKPGHYILKNVKLLLSRFNSRFLINADSQIRLTIEDSAIENAHGCLFTLTPETDAGLELKTGVFTARAGALTPSPFCVEVDKVNGDLAAAQALMRQILAEGAEFYQAGTNAPVTEMKQGSSNFGKLGDKAVFYLDAAQVAVQAPLETPALTPVGNEDNAEPDSDADLGSDSDSDSAVGQSDSAAEAESGQNGSISETESDQINSATEQELSQSELAAEEEPAAVPTEVAHEDLISKDSADEIVWKITKRETNSTVIPNDQPAIGRGAATAEASETISSASSPDPVKLAGLTKQTAAAQAPTRIEMAATRAKTAIPKAPNTGKAKARPSLLLFPGELFMQLGAEQRHNERSQGSNN